MKRIFALLLALLIPAAAFAGTPKEYVGPFRFEMEVETVQFGRYDQDNDPETEPEPIEWMVLEERDGKRLLFSRDLLEQKRFNETYGNNNWEGCTLRAWLNNEFMQTAFTEEERAAILLTHVDNSKEQDNPAYQDTNSGNDTDDYIFLISYKECVTYFPDTPTRRSAPTDHAIANGAIADTGYKINGRGCGFWWLRSIGPHPWRASMAYAPGPMRYTYFTRDFVGVRPMMWVDISKFPKEE